MSASAHTGSVKTTVTYLEMFEKPRLEPVVLPRELVIVRAVHPTVKFYRFLYDAVGADWNWTDRKRLTDSELAAEITNDLVDIFVLYEDGVPAGYVELDRRFSPDIELKYFGIMPEFIEKRYGKILLAWAIERGWSYSPKRFWVHTCSLDHPRALPLYQKLGFKIYKTEEYDQKL